MNRNHLNNSMSPPSASPFASSFSAFNLRNPSSVLSSDTSSNGSGMQVDTLESQYPLFRAGTNCMVAGGGASTSISMTGSVSSSHHQSSRRQSMLNRQILVEDEEIEGDHDGRLSLLVDLEDQRLSSAGDPRSDTDSPMLMNSPVMTPRGLPLTPSTTALLPTSLQSNENLTTDTIRQRRQKANIKSTRSTRARSTSLSLPASPNLESASLSASTITHMMTPPPHFLSRRRWTDQVGTSSAGSSSSGKEATPAEMRGSTEEEEEGVGVLNFGGGGERVVRRPVSRNPNLLPKPKSFLRVQRAEEGSSDALEIASEASLHRLSRSGPTNLPCPTAITPSSSSHPVLTSHSQPTKNRFPEQAEEEIETPGGESDLSVEEDEMDGASDWMSMGYATDDEDEKKLAEKKVSMMWRNNHSNGTSKSPGARGMMELASAPTTPAGLYRPGKRKTEDRFEPYVQAFKRRAVSPASINSPTFSQALSHPSPLPSSSTIPSTSSSSSYTTTTTIPISIPSPNLGPHFSFFSSLNNLNNDRGGSAGGGAYSSRGASPGSSASSSWGRPNMFGSTGTHNTTLNGAGREREKELEKSGRIGEAKDQLGNMSLG